MKSSKLKNKQNSNVKNTCKIKTYKLLNYLAYQMTHKSGHQMLESIKIQKDSYTGKNNSQVITTKFINFPSIG